MLVATDSPAAAQKTDVVRLVNGDSITCEIKTLNKGQLTADTDDMGTLHMEWDKVISVASKRIFQVETSGGDRWLGSRLRLAQHGHRRTWAVPW